MKLAREITRKKPVVIMKVGRTESGARAAQSHTAALSGSDEFSDAAFKQAGVIRVEEVGELVETALVLLGQPLPKGKKVAVLTVGGGLGVIAADALRKCGLEVPPLSSATMKKLNSVLSGRWSRGNPVDTSGDIKLSLPAASSGGQKCGCSVDCRPCLGRQPDSPRLSVHPPWERRE